MKLKFFYFNLFFIFLIIFSFRHFFVRGDSIWTGEWARFSWSVLMRGKSCSFRVRSDLSQSWSLVDSSELSFLQASNLDDPMILYQFIRARYCPPSQAAYAEVSCRLIHHHEAPLVLSSSNLCSASYHSFSRNQWIVPYPGFPDPDYYYWFSLKIKGSPLAKYLQ